MQNETKFSSIASLRFQILTKLCAKRGYKKIIEIFPNSLLEVKDSVLFVHNGKYITSAGGAKSFEAALYLCEFLYGKEIADSLAKGLVIDWNLREIPHLVVE